MKRADEARSRIKNAERRVLESEKSAADAILRERAIMEKEMRASVLKIAHLERQIAGKEFVERSVHDRMHYRNDQKLAAVQKQLDDTAELLRLMREREREREREAEPSDGDDDEYEEEDGMEREEDGMEGKEDLEGESREAAELRALRSWGPGGTSCFVAWIVCPKHMPQRY